MTGFRVRTHDSADVVDATNAAKVVSIYGGSGNDTLKGGNVADTIFGGDGDDLLVGGKGNDSLDGGVGSDSYQVAGTNDGTDIVTDRGGVGIDRIIAGAISTNINLSSSFSNASSGIETISANGFASVNVLGTSSTNLLNLSGMTLTGLAIIDSLAGADTVVGSDGGDLIRPGTGNDSVDGSNGTDIVYYAGTFATYSITRIGDIVQVKDLATTVNGNDGTDTLKSVEWLRFLDSDYSLIVPTNAAPVALLDEYAASEDDSGVTIPVLANDSDPDIGDVISIVSVNGVELLGSVSISADGLGIDYEFGDVFQSLIDGEVVTETFAYTIRDAAAEDGSRVIYSVGNAFQSLKAEAVANEVFGCAVSDWSGRESSANVTVTIIGMNDAPAAADDSLSVTDALVATGVDVLANDTDADIAAGDSLTIRSINSTGLQGTIQIVGASIVYSVGSAFQNLRAGVTVSEVFSYTAADRSGASSTTQVTVTVTGANDAPVAFANVLSLSEDAAPTTIAVLANDTDIDSGDTKTVLSVNGAGLLGSVVIAPGGTGVIYTVGNALQALNNGQTATETFSYTIVDSAGAQSTSLVTITIIGANEPVIYVNPPAPPTGAIVGTANDDIMIGTAAADIIYGQLGDDEIDGGNGDDTLFGGGDRDTLTGGAGNDVLSGGADSDDLTGGAGADIFRYYLVSESTVAAADKIKDFKGSEGDKIDLSLIDANYNVGEDNTFVMSSSFTTVAGQLVISSTTSGFYWVSDDVNGDGIADLQIEVRFS